MEQKKSYKGFLLWMLVFVVTMLGCAFLPIESGVVLTRIVMNVCVLNIVLHYIQNGVCILVQRHGI